MKPPRHYYRGTAVTLFLVLDTVLSSLVAVVLSGHVQIAFMTRGPETARAMSEQAQPAKVTKVDDGDNVFVSFDGKTESLRFIGYDSPENAQGNQPSQCFSLEATQKVKDDLLGQSVKLVPDSLQPDRDDQGRLLRYVSLGDQDYGKRLISEGFGREFTYRSKGHARQKEYQEAQTKAEVEKVGLWSKGTCNGDTLKTGIFLQPKAFRAVHPDPPSARPTCANFKQQTAAQRFYEANGGPFYDKFSLDPSRNGRPCANLP